MNFTIVFIAIACIIIAIIDYKKCIKVELIKKSNESNLSKFIVKKVKKEKPYIVEKLSKEERREQENSNTAWNG